MTTEVLPRRISLAHPPASAIGTAVQAATAVIDRGICRVVTRRMVTTQTARGRTAWGNSRRSCCASEWPPKSNATGASTQGPSRRGGFDGPSRCDPLASTGAGSSPPRSDEELQASPETSTTRTGVLRVGRDRSPKVILPAMHRPIPNVAVVCDTSGSMHEELLARALAEVEGLLARGGLRQAQVRVLAVDTNVHTVRRVSRASQVELAGGGGTDMGVGIAAAARLRPRPSVIVVLTDGFTPWPANPPKGVHVVVGILAQSTIPVDRFAPPAWARIVRIEPDGVLAG